MSDAVVTAMEKGVQEEILKEGSPDTREKAGMARRVDEFSFFATHAGFRRKSEYL